jgi:hypothetical protein
MIELIPFPDPEEFQIFQKSFSGFMDIFKILEIILGLPKSLRIASGSGRVPKLPKKVSQDLWIFSKSWK